MAATISTEIPCYICSDTIKKKPKTNHLNDEQKTKHTATPISQFIKKIIKQPCVQLKSSESDEDEDEKNSTQLKIFLCCKSCLNKINNYEKAILTAEQIQTELLQIYKQKIGVTIKSELDDVRAEVFADHVEVPLADNFNVKDSISDDSIDGEETKLNLKAENISFEHFGNVDFNDDNNSGVDDDDNVESDNITDDDDPDFDAGDSYTHDKVNSRTEVRESGTTPAKTEKIPTKKEVPKEKKSLSTGYQCTECSEKFTVKRKYEIHLKRHNRSKREKPVYKCELCARLFKVKYNYDRHLEVHSGKRDVQCNLCGKFYSKACYEKHKLVHRERANKCDLCDKLFKTKFEVLRHMPVHTGEKPYQCSICSKRFRFNTSIRTHNQRYHGTGPPRYECTLCHNLFETRAKLKSHFNIKHNRILTKLI